jgi:hypothetical protein
MPGTVHRLGYSAHLPLDMEVFPILKSDIAPRRRRTFEFPARMQNRLDPLFPPHLSELDLDTYRCFGGASHDVCPRDNLEAVASSRPQSGLVSLTHT